MQDKAIIYRLYYQVFVRIPACYFSALRCGRKDAVFLEILLDFSKIGDMKKIQWNQSRKVEMMRKIFEAVAPGIPYMETPLFA